jgi:hypothetical protein
VSERKREIQEGQSNAAKKKSVLDWVIDNTLARLLHERAGYRVGRPINLLGPRVKLLSPDDVIAIAQGRYNVTPMVHPGKVDDASPQND